MPENMLSFNDILEHFGEDTIRDRYRFLYDKMQEYISERELKNLLYINENILQQTIIDYFTDVYRLKAFHKIEHINKAKIVAYEVYWLLRRKPLQIKPIQQSENDYPDQKLVYANEGFSTTLIASELLAPKEAYPLSPDKEESFLTFLDQLYYHLKYRCVEKQSLELMLYAFDVGKQTS